MRKNSNFIGSEQDLVKSMKKYLPLYTSDIHWLDDIKETVDEQEYINICEAIAECVDRGYINNTQYLALMNKTISFTNKTAYFGEPPKGALEPFTLSNKGKLFLES